MNKHLKGAAAAAILSFAAAGSAHAAITVSILGGYGSYAGAGQTLVQDFDGFVAPGYNFSSTAPIYVGTGSSSGQYAEPVGAVGNYLAVQSGNGIDGSATLASLGGGFTAFSLFMGSPDTYNYVTINWAGGGSTVLDGNALSNGGTLFTTTGDQSLAYRVNIDFGGQRAQSVTLQSIGQNAFESDGWAVSAVPEPATWAMMITGFGLAGVAIRRRRTTFAVA